MLEENPRAQNARSGGGTKTSPATRQTVRQPVVINMSRPSSGGHNRNFPAQQSKPAVSAQPSYGKIYWGTPSQNKPQARAQPQSRQGQIGIGLYPRPDAKVFASPGQRAAVSVHHHPYTQGYVRKKLQKMGVRTEPSLITDRSEIIHTDRAHSTIRFPQKGPDHNPITATAISARHLNDEAVRDHMALVGSDEWRSRIGDSYRTETQAGHHYWHTDNGFNYCHYIDPNGYHWWGWYLGDQFFWTRDFGGRWWWYDTDYDRWCFWNDGNWWWQDPYHVGDLYCYNNDNYIPCNSAEDQVVVTASDNSNFQAYNSPDGTRTVKVATDTYDAFLYDTADPPSFQPVYLASGVESVTFSSTINGRPLEIILKLNDGSFDMFDAMGNAYNPGSFDADQAAQSSGANNQAPTVPSNPPSDPGAAAN